MTIHIAYLIGAAIMYPATARWALRDLAKIHPNDDDDRIFVAIWSFFPALLWPVFLPGFLIFKVLKPIAIRAMVRLEGDA